MPEENTLEKQPATEMGGSELMRSGVVYRPAVDIIQKERELVVLADMPGLDSDGIDIQFENGALTIHGRAQPRQGEETHYLMQEYGVGDFYRAFQISEQIDVSNISAEYSAGVLTLHLPKAAAVLPRKIDVAAK